MILFILVLVYCCAWVSLVWVLLGLVVCCDFGVCLVCVCCYCVACCLLLCDCVFSDLIVLPVMVEFGCLIYGLVDLCVCLMVFLLFGYAVALVCGL